MFAPRDGAAAFAFAGSDELAFGPARGDSAALTELDRRFADCRSGIVARLARDFGLQRHDIDDTLAQAFLWFHEAVHGYAGSNGRSFRSYLYEVLNHRFQDYVRGMRRRTLRQQRIWAQAAAYQRPRKSGPGDPAWEAGQREEKPMMDAMLARLTDEERQLLDFMLDYGGMARAARHWNVSYDIIRGRWKKLREKLQGLLKEFRE